MHWLHLLDVGLLRFINQTLSNRFFDWLMPVASGNKFFFPVVFMAAMLLMWKGGNRGRLCVLMLALIVWPGDSLICNTIKHAIGRPRPFVVLSGVRLPMSRKVSAPALVPGEQNSAASKGLPDHNSMPSSHAANWFAGAMILFVYYRRSWRFMLPLACLVSISRIYNGVHYPSDVLTGAILGAGYAVAGMWAVNAFWRFAGRKWFPLWWRKVPSLGCAESGVTKGEGEGGAALAPEQHWLQLGYVFIAATLFFRLWYIGSGTIELTGDEAYQWIWSKHLALSYYSKPLLIAYTQWLGTHLWGDTGFGVRFFSPVLAAIGGLVLFRFLARAVNARAAFIFLLITATCPLVALGSVLMTVDPLSVFFWILAMVAGWRAVLPESKTSDWFWTGFWMGLGFLSKYTELLQLVCWVVFFALWKPARAQLRKPGPWVAVLVNILSSMPVLIWNSQHHWITVSHVEGNAGMGHKWDPRVLDFVASEAALWNILWFLAAIWAAVAFWRRQRRDPLSLYLFSMGAPLFLCYFLWSFHSGIKPNWIAPCILPMFCLAVVYWNGRWPEVKGWARPLLILGIVGGALFVALLHDTNVVQKLVGKPLPPKPDPLTRARGYEEVARVVEVAREKLAAEGTPVFIIGDHYQTAGELTFYLAEARTNAATRPLIYSIKTEQAENQFYFWPGYEETRKGQNAIYVREMSMPSLVHGWVLKWLSGESETNLWRERPKPAEAPPAMLTREFNSVKNLGCHYIYYRGRIFHILELYECRDLRR